MKLKHIVSYDKKNNELWDILKWIWNVKNEVKILLKFREHGVNNHYICLMFYLLFFIVCKKKSYTRRI